MPDICASGMAAFEEQTSAGNAEEARANLGKKLQVLRHVIAQYRLKGEKSVL